jgi:hypothetical protein
VFLRFELQQITMWFQQYCKGTKHINCNEKAVGFTAHVCEELNVLNVMLLKLKMAMCVNHYMNCYIACCGGVFVIVKTFSSRAYSKLFRVFFVLAPKGYRNSAVFNIPISRRIENMCHHSECG